MSALSKEKRLNLALELIEENGFTAYEIANFTGKNRTQIHRILKREITNPQQSTINALFDFLETKLQGMAIPGHKNYRPDLIKRKEELAQVAEPSTEYATTKGTDLMSQFLSATEENRRLNEENRKLMLKMQEDIRVIAKLKNLLEKHDIDFSHITEP